MAAATALLGQYERAAEFRMKEDTHTQRYTRRYTVIAPSIKVIATSNWETHMKRDAFSICDRPLCLLMTVCSINADLHKQAAVRRKS